MFFSISRLYLLLNEMMQAGIIEEMIQDSFDAVEEDGIEDEADAEVEKILSEITSGLLGQAAAAPTKDTTIAAEPQAQEEDMDEMRQRLSSLKSWIK